MKEQILSWIERDRDELIAFLRDFARAESPNPPGDTRKAAAVVTRFLEAKGVPFKVAGDLEIMPNVIGSFEGAEAGRTLVLNGHMDVFPVTEPERWTYGPWDATIADGKIYARGICDMKCGTAASAIAYVYLHRLKERLRGRLTFTAVSDEETFGPHGAGFLLERFPEARGDCCLNGEPSSPFTLRFGERGLLWVKFTVRTPGAHGAYPHLSPNAAVIGARFVQDLIAAVEAAPFDAPADVVNVLEDAGDAIDRALGAGGKNTIGKIKVNIGSFHAGVKINMIPGVCEIEGDLRLPVGATRETILGPVRDVLARYPEISMEEINYNAPNWSDPNGEMSVYIQNNVKNLLGFAPAPIVSLGGSDLRFWRRRGIPAYYYGPPNKGMGTFDEYVEIDTFLHIVRTHALCAYDYLSPKGRQC